MRNSDDSNETVYSSSQNWHEINTRLSDNPRNSLEMVVVEHSGDDPGETINSTEVYRAKALIHRERRASIAASWKNSHEKLLYIWSEKSAGYRWLHMRCHEYFIFMNNVFTYPIIVLSSAMGFGSFILSQLPQFNDKVYIIYILAACNLIVAIFTSLQKFHRYAENSEKHLSIAIQYAIFYRELNMELSLDKSERHDAKEFCKTMKSQYDRLLMNTISIPSHVIVKFNKTFPNILHRPDVANGLFDLRIQKH